jgi:hypothetical protein
VTTPGLRAFNNPILDSGSKAPTVWGTPKKSKDLREQGRRFLAGATLSPADRFFMRKVYKGFDELTFQLATAKQQLEAAQNSLELTRATKRRKVQLDPNERFAGIDEIRASQRGAGREELVLPESPEEEDSGSEDCIIVSH